jgi:histidinol-phosphate aminotransferase
MVTTDDLPPDVHGGVDLSELSLLGLRPDQVLDFSANINPFGPSPTVREAVNGVAFDRYPDRMCLELSRELAARHGVAEERVLVGNGSTELIWLTVVAFLKAGDRVVILGPTFSGYERSSRLMEAQVLTCRAREVDGFCPPFDAFDALVEECQPKLAFLANPNNPTGKSVPLVRVYDLAVRHQQTLFVLDEAYADPSSRFVRQADRVPENVLRLRSLTKAHGLAGLRLGYAVGAEAVIAVLRAAQPPWSVNAAAQAAGLAALRDERHLRETLASWSAAGAELIERLRGAGFSPIPSETPFFLLPVGDAASVRTSLLRRGILVRDCTSFGLPGHVRISGRTREDNARIVTALVETRAEGGTWAS